MTNDDWVDDDTPWADPAIRLRYEALLGAFMLHHNAIDDMVLRLVTVILRRLGRTDLPDQPVRGSFYLRLYVLDLLKSTPEGCALTVAQMKELYDLTTFRNDVAHGHMDQNPFQGSYDLLSKGKLVKGDFSLGRMEEMAKRADEAHTMLRHAMARYEFEPINLQDLRSITSS